MSAELRIGLRVRTGWSPPSDVCGGGDDPRLRRGILRQGPFLPGSVHAGADGGLYAITQYPMWLVEINGCGLWMVAEPLIFPDDGDPDTAFTREKEREIA